MSRQRYPEEFKIEAVKQVIEKDKPVADVAQRLGMCLPWMPPCHRHKRRDKLKVDCEFKI